MYLAKSARLALYVQNQFGKGSSKSAEGVLRYGANPIACVIDESSAGKAIGDVGRRVSTAGANCSLGGAGA